MTIKRILILLPVILILFLLQSYFWVPTYEEQTRGNPERLTQFINASIGDAGILNPILAADSASSDIVSMVFEGLVDRDKDLRFRGRLAVSWELHEEALFHINDAARIPGIQGGDATAIRAVILNAKDKSETLDPVLRKTLHHIQEILVLPPREFTERFSMGAAGKESENKEIPVRVKAPPAIKLVLDRVDQDLFKNLSLLLGEDYFSSFDAERFVSIPSDADKSLLKGFAEQLVPACEHNPVLMFHLRPGVKFHDGHVFDAGDVKFTYEAIMDPESLSPRVPDFEPVRSVEILDDLTVKIIYKRLYSPALGTWAMQILPEHLLNPDALKAEAVSLGKDPETFSIRQSRFNRSPVGCGPFVFQEWRSDQYIVLNRFEDYWEGPPNYRQYVYRIIPDLLTQEMEFYAGTIDTYGVLPHQVKRLSDLPEYQSFSGLSFGYAYIGYNLRREPFDDARVRRALGMAIDVDKIIEYVLYSQGERITGPFVKQTDFYNHEIKPLPYDPKGALSILEGLGWKQNQAGWLEKDGKIFRFTLITNNGNPLREEILAIAQDAWKKIGIDVRTDRVEWSVFIQERVNKLDFDALILGWSMGIDPDLYQIWHSSQTNPQQLNFVGFKNEEADDLIIRIRQEYDHENLVKYCRRLHEIIAREQPYTFLNVGKWTAIMDKRIVIKTQDKQGGIRYERIKPTKTGVYTFDFNKWIKLPEMPAFTP